MLQIYLFIFPLCLDVLTGQCVCPCIYHIYMLTPYIHVKSISKAFTKQYSLRRFFASQMPKKKKPLNMLQMC